MTTLNDALLKFVWYHQTREDLETALHLIKVGADPNLRCTRYHSAITILWPVVDLDDPEFFAKFVEAGCDPLVKTKGYVETILDRACGNSCYKVADWLLTKGYFKVDESPPSNEKSKRIHRICAGNWFGFFDWKQKTMKLVEVFVKHGANLLEQDEHGRLPLDYARSHNMETGVEENALMKYLKDEMEKQHAVLPNDPPKPIEKPLTAVPLTGVPQIIQLLKEFKEVEAERSQKLQNLMERAITSLQGLPQ